MMKKFAGMGGTMLLLGGVLIARGITASNASKLTLRDIPTASQKVIEQQASGKEVKAVFKQNEGGVVTYEAEWMVAGMKHEAVVTANGTLVATEKLVPASGVPEDIRAKAAKYFPIGTKIAYEERLVVQYEAEAIVDGKAVEVLLTATGKIVEALETTVAVADDDDEGDDDEGDDDNEDN